MDIQAIRQLRRNGYSWEAIGEAVARAEGRAKPYSAGYMHQLANGRARNPEPKQPFDYSKIGAPQALRPRPLSSSEQAELVQGKASPERRAELMARYKAAQRITKS